MDVRSCRACGKLFNYMDNGVKICPSCAEIREKKFQEVKEYIRENRTATLGQISEEMDVSIKQLQQWVREERLEFTEGSGVMLNCESCGTAIRTGRFCEKCKNNMSSALSNAFKKPVEEEPVRKPKESDKMRFLK